MPAKKDDAKTKAPAPPEGLAGKALAIWRAAHGLPAVKGGKD